MAFYDLSKEERKNLTEKIRNELIEEFRKGVLKKNLRYFSDEDTYIRKSAYLAVGKIYMSHLDLRIPLLEALEKLFADADFKTRQTTINAAGEIGKTDFKTVAYFFDKGLYDEHHAVRNAVIGSIKKMGEKNPVPVLAWAKKHLHHENKEIRREICHGIELRGRTHPQDILPLLKELEFDKTARVKNTLVHVLGQISYKKGCLETVVAHLKLWENEEIVKRALEEIVIIHDRYKEFAFRTKKEASAYIKKHYFEE